MTQGEIALLAMLDLIRQELRLMTLAVGNAKQAEIDKTTADIDESMVAFNKRFTEESK